MPTPMIGRHKMLLAALLAGHGLLAWQLRARGIFTFGDDAAYLLLNVGPAGISITASRISWEIRWRRVFRQAIRHFSPC